MKKKHLINLSSIAIVIMVAFFACNKEPSSNMKNERVNNKNLGKSAGSCNCPQVTSNGYCDNCVVTYLMNNTNPAQHTINWPSGCGGGKTTLKFCYDDFLVTDDCYIFMEIDYLPPSLQCAFSTFPYCLRGKIKCEVDNNGDYSITVVPDDVALAEHFTVVFSEDDKIVNICCDNNCCTGIWQ